MGKNVFPTSDKNRFHFYRFRMVMHDPLCFSVARFLPEVIRVTDKPKTNAHCAFAPSRDPTRDLRDPSRYLRDLYQTLTRAFEVRTWKAAFEVPPLKRTWSVRVVASQLPLGRSSVACPHLPDSLPVASLSHASSLPVTSW